MLWRPSILNYMNNSQHDALFIFGLLGYHICNVSGISVAHHQEVECIYVANGKCYTSELTVTGPRWTAKPADSQLRSITSTICHIHAFYLLMIGC
jgi:hypothetical protein